MRVLIACEFSGIVREAFNARGHDAWSCDLLPSQKPGQHIQGDALKAMRSRDWDLMIAHPPCKFLALCQAWRKRPSAVDCLSFGLEPANETWRPAQRELAVEFARALWASDIPRICLENPKSILTTRLAPKSQTIHPWQFGHGETKTTWLWLKNLPLLIPTNIVKGREERIWKMSPSPERSTLRSVTYVGIAKAMAEQWT